MKRFLTAVLSLLSAASFAQYTPLGAVSSWTDGYIVTAQNDTVRGKMRVGMLLNDAPQQVIFKNADGKKQTYKADNIVAIAQRIPFADESLNPQIRERQYIYFDKISHPRRNGKMLLTERLSRTTGKLALYFDASGWKQTQEFSFGNFTIATDPKDLSFVVVKRDAESFVVKRGNIQDHYENLFGDCATFVKKYPDATRRDWNRFGELVDAYNSLCVVGLP